MGCCPEPSLGGLKIVFAKSPSLATSLTLLNKDEPDAAGASNEGTAAWNEPGAAVNGAALAAVSTLRPGKASWNEPGQACN
jgi:hypothetical protein